MVKASANVLSACLRIRSVRYRTQAAGAKIQQLPVAMDAIHLLLCANERTNGWFVLSLVQTGLRASQQRALLTLNRHHHRWTGKNVMNTDIYDVKMKARLKDQVTRPTRANNQQFTNRGRTG